VGKENAREYECSPENMLELERIDETWKHA
jgi:hypothetical protein